MPNSTKAIIAIVSVIILSSGIFVLTKSRPVENPAVTVSSSSVAVQVSSSSKSILSSSSQVVSSSSQSEVVKVVESPKVESPKIEASKMETIQPIVEETKPKQDILNYEFSYSLNQRGTLELSNKDINFLNENIKDVAAYYYKTIQPQYSNKKIYIYANNVKKIDNLNYFIAFENTIVPQSVEGSTVRSYNPKVYKLTAINEKDGEFEESTLPNLYSYPILNSNIINNEPAKIAPPGHQYTGGHD